MALQVQWRYCEKCQALFFDGFPDKGRCPAGGGHQSAGFLFALPHDVPGTPTAQDSWRYCEKCSALFFDGFPDKGRCAAGDGHQSAGFLFILPHDIPPTATAQNAWRYCEKCHALFFDGFPQKGACPAGGGHQAAGFMFVLPHDLPGVLDFDFSPIVLGGGVPVGGHAHLTLRQDGSYTFSGHFHDSGGTEYNMAIVVGVKDSQNRVYTFQQAGHVAGTFESGSRNFDWNVESQNPVIADNWAFLGAGSTAQQTTSANGDFIGLTNSLIGTLGTVLGIVAIVIA